MMSTANKYLCGLYILVCLNFILFLPVVIAQVRPQWDDIPAGPHDIGFKVIHTYDHSRGYWPKVDHTGMLSDHETARPMQLSIWYPADVDQGPERMVFGDYIELLASELGKEQLTNADRQQAQDRLRMGPLNPYFPDGVSDQDLQNVLDTPVPVTKNAEPVQGAFPLVIHAGFGLMGQSVMNEYLASHGYVVVSFPVLSTHPAWYHRGEGTMAWYQAIADDIGFVYGEMRNFSAADRSRAAVIGMFAAAGLLYQMQNMQLDAIASLDGRYPDVIRNAPEFNPDKIRIPILDMPSVNNTENRAMLDSMHFAQRHVVRFDSVRHREFYQFRRIARPEKSEDDISYKIIARYTKAFLDGILKDDNDALSFLKQDPEGVGAPSYFMSTDFMSASASPPTEDEFLLMVRNGEIAKARQVFQDVKKKLPDYRISRESSLRTVAFFYRRDHSAKASVEVFNLWSEMFPDSWMAKDQLGNTYAQAGDLQSAMQAYEEAIVLIEQDENLPAERKSDYIGQLKREIEDKNKQIENNEHD